MTRIFPAPWHLEGNGYVLIYRLSSIRKMPASPFLQNSLTDSSSISGLGALMLVDYKSSTAGPYRELLFTPGRIRFDGEKYHTITRIFVSTMESVFNGQKNWGIPKEKADFKRVRTEKRQDRFSVSRDHEKIMDIEMEKGRFAFPVSTALFPLSLLQEMDSRVYETRPMANGTARLAKIRSLEINGSQFPDISSVKPLVGLYINKFRMTFPKAVMQG